MISFVFFIPLHKLFFYSHLYFIDFLHFIVEFFVTSLSFLSSFIFTFFFSFNLSSATLFYFLLPVSHNYPFSYPILLFFFHLYLLVFSTCLFLHHISPFFFQPHLSFLFSLIALSHYFLLTSFAAFLFLLQDDILRLLISVTCQSRNLRIEYRPIN